MPKLEENALAWGKVYQWVHYGDEWSQGWGGVTTQWHAVIFPRIQHIEYYVNDGRSLGMVEDSSLDFVFSHDALVHVEVEDMREYLRELALKLQPNGVAFLHHSNLAAYWYYQKLSQPAIKWLRRYRLIEGDS
jgi:hypothetical protein